MALFSSWAADKLAFFTWQHAGMLFFALLGGACGFLGYYTDIKSNADKELANWEWQRSGRRVRSATWGELYAHNNKGRSLRQAETRGRFTIGMLISSVMAVISPVFLQGLMDAEDIAWAESYPLIVKGGGINTEALAASLLFLLPAFFVGSRLMFGIARWIRLLRREKSGRMADALNPGERACRGLSKADFILSLAFLLLLAYPIARAFMAVFGERTARLPEAYYDGSLLKWQLGASAAYLLWAVVQSAVRAARMVARQFG